MEGLGKVIRGLCLLAVLALTACGGGSGPHSTDAEIDADDVDIAEEEATEGETVDAENEVVNLSSDDIVSFVGDKSITVYVPANKEASEYVSYNLIRIGNPLWILSKAYLNSLEPGTLNFKKKLSGQPIVRSGEWSRALAEKGAEDWVGGAHGSEVTRSIVLNNNLDWIRGSLIAKKINIETKSEVYSNKSETVIADISTAYNFDSERLQVIQAIDWRQTASFGRAYLSMFPVQRKLDTGEQITDIGYRSPDYFPEDIMTDEFPLKVTSGTRVVRLEGSWSGLVFEVSLVRSSGAPEPSVFITNSPIYNKIYFDFGGTVEEGDSWEVVTEYRISK